MSELDQGIINNLVDIPVSIQSAETYILNGIGVVSGNYCER